MCGGVKYITSSYIPSYKKNILQHYKINVQVGLHCKVEWQKHIFRIVKSQAPDVKNISLNNKIIPCAKLVIIIEQGIISLVK